VVFEIFFEAGSRKSL